MEPRCIPHGDLPHTTRLLTDFLYHFDRVAPYYGLSPLDSSSYGQAASRLRYPDERRAALVSALRSQNGDHPSLDLLARPGTAVVATGQQVGLFSGPAYTIYKALTAARLARRLTEEGMPAVPVFWLATEDHDFQEINHCWVFDGDARPVRLEAEGQTPAGQPVGRIPVRNSPSSDLEQALRGLPFGAEVAALVAQSYAQGSTYGSAFAELLRKLLSSCGILFLDPLEPPIRELAAPLLRQAAEAGPDLVRLLIERNKALEDSGYHAQVRVEPQTSLVFLLDGDKRVPLRRRDGDYVNGDRRFSSEELAGRAAQLSPNALLRPVTQDYILPTVAYVGGPAELAYLAQSQVIYESLLGRMPVPVHRASFTLLDARSQKRIERYGLPLAGLFHGEEALRESIAATLIPPTLGRGLRQASDETAARLERLRAEMLGFDPTLAAALDTSGRKILYQFSKIERKAGRESLRRDERARRDAASLSNLVYPQKHLQERIYSILPFLARHGLDLIGRIGESICLDCPDHQFLVF